jgi:hypothetical protein
MKIPLPGNRNIHQKNGGYGRIAATNPKKLARKY